MSDRKSLGRRMVMTGGYLIVWILVILAFSAQSRIANDLEWSIAFQRTINDWLPWVLLAPLIFLLSQRFRLSPATWKRSLLVHLFGAILFAIAAETITSGLIAPLSGLGPPFPEPSELQAPQQGPAGWRPGMPPSGGPHGLPPPHAGPPGMGLPPDNRQGLHWWRLLARKTQFWFPAYWLVVVGATAFANHQEARERHERNLELQKELAEARLTFLKQQLEPHFLFNALNALSTLVHRSPEQADTMISHLSKLLRMVLKSGERRLVPFSDELEMVENYLAIQRLRFGELLKVDFQIKDDTRRVELPPMVLQPLVENAVRHGIERIPEGGWIRVFAALEDSPPSLMLEVSNDLPKETDSSGNQSTQSGLQNLEARLASIYGPDAARLETGKIEGRFRVMIRLPLLPQELA